MWYIGMDVHQRSTTVCVLDEQGRYVKRETIRRPWPEAAKWVQSLTHRRAALSADMMAVKHRIHAVLHQRLIEPPVKGLFREAGLAWLERLALDEDGRADLDSDLRLLRALTEEQDVVDRRIQRIA